MVKSRNFHSSDSHGWLYERQAEGIYGLIHVFIKIKQNTISFRIGMNALKNVLENCLSLARP
ncbi:MAG: hypothetical protein HY096_06730 [Nitrospinae bacterium]|nr:hypothetical protein [Nitrospinota bacterium]